MEFKTRISYNFITKLILVLLMMIMATLSIFAADITEAFKYFFFLIAVIAVVRLAVSGRLIYLMLYKKPALVITEDHIYDAIRKIRYDRKDILEVYEDNAYLYIVLRDPAAYLNKIGDTLYRWVTNVNYQPNSEKTPFRIDLDFIDIGENDLLEILESHVVRSTEIENPDISGTVTYYFKWSASFAMIVLQLSVFLGLMIQWLRGGYKGYLLPVVCILFVIAVNLPKLVKSSYFWIKKRPMLTANGSFIFDGYGNIKYYWNDVDEIIVSDSFLRIKLYEPEKYIDKVRDPFDRFFKQIGYRIFKRNPSYSINLDVVDIKKDEHKKFVDSLDAFSLASGG